VSDEAIEDIVEKILQQSHLCEVCWSTKRMDSPFQHPILNGKISNYRLGVSWVSTGPTSSAFEIRSSWATAAPS